MVERLRHEPLSPFEVKRTFVKKAWAAGAHKAAPPGFSNEAWPFVRRMISIYYRTNAIIEDLAVKFDIDPYALGVVIRTGITGLRLNCPSTIQKKYPRRALWTDDFSKDKQNKPKNRKNKPRSSYKRSFQAKENVLPKPIEIVTNTPRLDPPEASSNETAQSDIEKPQNETEHSLKENPKEQVENIEYELEADSFNQFDEDLEMWNIAVAQGIPVIMLQKKWITEGELKACSDYFLSRGKGKIPDTELDKFSKCFVKLDRG